MGKSDSAEDQHCSNLCFSVSRPNALPPQGMRFFSNWDGHGIHDVWSISGAGEGPFQPGWGGCNHSLSSSGTLGWMVGISQGQRVSKGHCSSCAQCLERTLCGTHFCRTNSAWCLLGLASHAGLLHGAFMLTSLSAMMVRAVPQPCVKRNLPLRWRREFIWSGLGPFALLRDSLRLQEGNFHLSWGNVAGGAACLYLCRWEGSHPHADVPLLLT